MKNMTPEIEIRDCHKDKEEGAICAAEKCAVLNKGEAKMPMAAAVHFICSAELV